MSPQTDQLWSWGSVDVKDGVIHSRVDVELIHYAQLLPGLFTNSRTPEVNVLSRGSARISTSRGARTLVAESRPCLLPPTPTILCRCRIQTYYVRFPSKPLKIKTSQVGVHNTSLEIGTPSQSENLRNIYAECRSRPTVVFTARFCKQDQVV